MPDFSKTIVLALALASLTACARVAPSATRAAAEESAIKAVSIAWKNAYNAGDVAAVTALYAEDAVLSAPGAPALRGIASISEYFTATIAQFSASGFTVRDRPMGEVVASGDLAWQWQTYQVIDRSGTVVDAGTLVTLFRRRDAQWKIAGDTWNSDGTADARTPPQD